MKGWTSADIERLQSRTKDTFQNQPVEAAIKKPSKYGNKKVDGFDSIHEKKCYEDLLLKEKAGLITALQRQVSFELQDCRYIADFVYFNRENNAFEVADAKGMKTPVYRLKKKMMKTIHGIEIIEL